ncbi:MAG: hypothetical protein V2J51_12980 [Erythrobacter sp.]|jgi:hypothetical protein|nr:hypothetical protein [Erythrobacter sp.]
MNDTIPEAAKNPETNVAKPVAAPPQAITPEEKRDMLRAKIDASEKRIAERTLADQAKEAAGAAADYTRANPLTVIGGAVAIGLIIGLLTPAGRRTARNAAYGAAGYVGGAARQTRRVASDAGEKTSEFGDKVTGAMAAFGMKLLDDAIDGVHATEDALEDLSDGATARARKLRREAAYLAGNTADAGRMASRRARRKASRAGRDLVGSLPGRH